MPDIKITGRRPVIEALEAKLPLKEVFIAAGSEGRIIEKIEALARKNRVSLRKIRREHFQRMADQNSQGVCAFMRPLPTKDIDALLASLEDVKNPALALLDGIEDPRNLGAILRVADGAGVDSVLIPTRRSASLTPGAIKTSAGAAFHVPVTEVASIARAIDRLKKNGFVIVGTDSGQDDKPWDVDLNRPVAFVFGKEGKGMSSFIRGKCDVLVSLPMLGKIDSLNVSTAAAAFFYEMARQRAGSSDE